MLVVVFVLVFVVLMESDRNRNFIVDAPRNTSIYMLNHYTLHSPPVSCNMDPERARREHWIANAVDSRGGGHSEHHERGWREEQKEEESEKWGS